MLSEPVKIMTKDPCYALAGYRHGILAHLCVRNQLLLQAMKW